MKRIRAEITFHVSDSCDEQEFAARFTEHVNRFRDPERSANHLPHYESCVVSVEDKTWRGLQT